MFLLIGQQLPAVVAGLGKYATSHDRHRRRGHRRRGAAAAAAVAAAHPVAAAVAAHPARQDSTDDDDDGRPRPDRLSRPADGSPAGVVVSWAGTRGVISLAAIFTLPLVTDGGEPFPDRDLLLFCTFLVVLVTLVGQGLTFAPLVRALRPARRRGRPGAAAQRGPRWPRSRRRWRRLDEMEAEQHDDVDDRAIGRHPRPAARPGWHRYRRRLDLLDNAEAGEIPLSPRVRGGAAACGARCIEAQREELLRWRDVGRLPDEGLRAAGARAGPRGRACCPTARPAG